MRFKGDIFFLILLFGNLGASLVLVFKNNYPQATFHLVFALVFLVFITAFGIRDKLDEIEDKVDKQS